MTVRVLQPADWARPIGYANGIAVPAGEIVFIAGQVGWDEKQHFASADLVPQYRNSSGRSRTCSRCSKRPAARRATSAG